MKVNVLDDILERLGALEAAVPPSAGKSRWHRSAAEEAVLTGRKKLTL